MIPFKKIIIYMARQKSKFSILRPSRESMPSIVYLPQTTEQAENRKRNAIHERRARACVYRVSSSAYGLYPLIRLFCRLMTDLHVLYSNKMKNY